MKKIILLTLATSLFCFMSCSESEDFLQTMEIAEEIQIDGNCDVYSLENNESASWSIVETPKWITPVTLEGGVSDAIELYVESNGSAVREGVVTVKYSNGKTISTRVSQDTVKVKALLPKSHAIGWGFDITTYMDSRGLKDQIFNTQKVIKNLGPQYIQYENSKSSETLTFYGDDYQALNDNISASFSGNVKVSAFELGLKGQFGNNAIKDTKRFFSWMRGTYVERRANIKSITLGDAYGKGLLTIDFEDEYKKVVSSGGSDESIRNLISRYGTHIVTISYLGGYLDYYYSSSVEKIDETMNIKGAINFGYNNMFKVGGDGSYKETYNDLKYEMIEKFTVKGGNAIDITNKVITKTMKKEDLDNWLKSLQGEDAKLELVNFQIEPISSLFPYNIAKTINNYIARDLYYGNVNITRANIENE